MISVGDPNLTPFPLITPLSPQDVKAINAELPIRIEEAEQARRELQAEVARLRTRLADEEAKGVVAKQRHEAAEQNSNKLDDDVTSFRAKWEESNTSAQAIKQTVAELRAEIAAGATREKALSEQIRNAERDSSARKQQKEEALHQKQQQKEELLQLQHDQAKGHTERHDSLKQASCCDRLLVIHQIQNSVFALLCACPSIFLPHFLTPHFLVIIPTFLLIHHSKLSRGARR